MFVTTPHLTARGPSPTMVQYAVSNAPHRRSVAAQAMFALAVLLRIIAVLLALLFLAVKFQCSSNGRSLSEVGTVATSVSAGNGDWRSVCGDNLLSQYGTLLFDHTALRQPWELAVSLCAVVFWLCCRRYHTEESLLVMRTLGIQTATASRSYLGSATTRFIPTSQIQDIFIHEAFIGFEVRYYLAIVVEGERDLTVVFPSLLPNLAIVEEVWRGARACLFEVRPKAVR